MTADSLLESLVHCAGIYQRNGVSYLVARRWRSDAKKGAVALLRQAKASGCCHTCAAGVADIAALLVQIFGSLGGSVITSVPCGHSKVSNCLGRRLAEGVAQTLEVPYVQVWEDRFVSGVSHPKEFSKLPPLQWLRHPGSRAIVVDDVATSGWHIEEALRSLRAAGVEAAGVAWIGGTRGSGGNSGQPEETGSPFGGRSGRWAGSGGRRGQWGVQGQR